jgi:hypothetical protein
VSSELNLGSGSEDEIRRRSRVPTLSVATALTAAEYKQMQRNYWGLAARGWREWWHLFESALQPVSDAMVNRAAVRPGPGRCRAASRPARECAVPISTRIAPNRQDAAAHSRRLLAAPDRVLERDPETGVASRMCRRWTWRSYGPG